ncbi:MAG TPA: Rab family GTPase [Blastocatellia bacterium]|nr:Rab family GTPase [Blastocatellia bacterium]
MLQKKICMLGASAVGKTSLVARYVQGIFSEKYLTTVGVKIDKKPVTVGGVDVLLMLWDMQGEDRFQKVQMSYLRGAAGYFLVADGTRRDTLDRALILQKEAEATAGAVPFVLLLNKSDLEDEWDIEDAALAELTASGWTVLRSSALSGLNVDEAFQLLAQRTTE